MKIKEEVVKIIDNSNIKGNKLWLPQALDRKTYVAVNKVLELMGLKWNKKEKCHIAGSDISEIVNDIINTGEVIDHKKEDQFYETPREIVEMMISAADIKEDDTVLEPSAGHGAILSVLTEKYPSAMFGFVEKARPGTRS
jgi:hypothetical protein